MFTMFGSDRCTAGHDEVDTPASDSPQDELLIIKILPSNPSYQEVP